MLVELGVAALGVNFWPRSKRFIAPREADGFLRRVAGKILRVAVVVNAEQKFVREIFTTGLVDVVQLHGDESPDYCAALADAMIPVIKALPAEPALLETAGAYPAQALLVDTPAGAAYGGTGQPCDWSLAAELVRARPDLPILLAGGITSANASEAITQVHPAALDVASGAESAPGIKDREKVRQLQQAISAARLLG